MSGVAIIHRQNRTFAMRVEVILASSEIFDEVPLGKGVFRLETASNSGWQILGRVVGLNFEMEATP